MSSWRWQPSRGGGSSGRPVERGPVVYRAQEAYRIADEWFAAGAARVSILLVATDGRAGLADSRERGRYGDEWVVGLARWLENEREAVREGRA